MCRRFDTGVECAEAEITIDPLRTRYLTLTTRAEDEGRKLAARIRLGFTIRFGGWRFAEGVLTT
jgi:hypothetical protein